MTEKKIPRATAKRLPLYYRYLKYLDRDGVHRISSAEISDILKIDSATIRRDFSYFGTLGKRGYGYNVSELADFFGRQLKQDVMTHVALVGAGHLGRALLNYNFSEKNNIRISVAFDVKEDLLGKEFNGIPVYHLDELEEQITHHQLDLVILTVPALNAQEVTDRLVHLGVKGMLNFTPIRLDVPEDVIVHDVDLSSELQSLVYFVEYRDRIEGEE